MAEHFTFKSYSWSLGTTSFRMAKFHRKVEEQLILLDRFWNIPDNKSKTWKSNVETQASYYDFLYDNSFVDGEIQDKPDKKSKTARQKTSGLVDIGLIDKNRRITAVGKRLLDMSLKNDFTCDNDFQIPKDSYLFLKQVMKTTCITEDWKVRPFLVVGSVLKKCDEYLTDDEFTYLVPLCVSQSITEDIIDKIHLYRKKLKTIDQIIVESVLRRYNYPDALEYFIRSNKTPDIIKSIGMNRDGTKHDECYVELYKQLRKVYINHDENSVPSLLKAAKAVKHKPGVLWKKLLFANARKHSSFIDLAHTHFDDIKTDKEFDKCFFTYLHLIKIKANLSDYKDLNRRYLKITDAFIFDDGKIAFSPLFSNFFKTKANETFADAFTECKFLVEDCSLSKINPNLVFNKQEVVDVFNSENNVTVQTIEDVYDFIETSRYNRFRNLIDTRFPNPVIISMLDKFESRKNDNELIELAGGDADVPTIFEYIIGVAWYRLSGYTGKILDYMNLSLDINLLPRTHAGGGESDIVYKYSETSQYPAHSLLIECTLMEGTTQRHGEMEPVSRHLANYMIDEDKNAYCTFVSNNLHASVMSDFRMRKNFPYYRNENEYVNGMKIIPFHTNELKSVIEKNISYAQLYNIFDKAHKSSIEQSPSKWYNSCIKAMI